MGTNPAVHRRVTKGLIRKNYPAVDYSNDVFRVGYVSPNEPRLLDLLAGTKGSEIGSDTFFYRHGLTDMQMTGIWYLLFYEHHGFLIVHTKHPDVSTILTEWV